MKAKELQENVSFMLIKTVLGVLCKRSNFFMDDYNDTNLTMHSKTIEHTFND